MVSTSYVCHSSRCKQTRNSLLLIRAVQQSTLSSSLRRNKQIMARGNNGVVSRRRAMQKNNRRKVLEGSRKPVGPIVRKIQKLRQLVPGGDTTEIDDLFCAAADYILTLQMKCL
ncbi:hypothetical protein LUZ61_005822 [Rhynchospora tenuis]|uniref:BHLH domain-containing protein n=1 Tax=Rhynchospora tenuis TaxID=198213 RepID=A0AAD6EUX7_9POAL|nr:hypothetical protein LUZ61_005822 [Rhynchospora tenuis]